MTQTWVTCTRRDTRPEMAAWYRLAFDSVEPSDVSVRMRQGVARHPIPVMVLARLAVDLRYQRQGLGRAMLKDALLRSEQAADIVGKPAPTKPAPTLQKTPDTTPQTCQCPPAPASPAGNAGLPPDRSRPRRWPAHLPLVKAAGSS